MSQLGKETDKNNTSSGERMTGITFTSTRSLTCPSLSDTEMSQQSTSNPGRSASTTTARVLCYHGTLTDNNNQGEQIQEMLKQQNLLSGVIIHPAGRQKKPVSFWPQKLQCSVKCFRFNGRIAQN